MFELMLLIQQHLEHELPWYSVDKGGSIKIVVLGFIYKIDVY